MPRPARAQPLPTMHADPSRKPLSCAWRRETHALDDGEAGVSLDAPDGLDCPTICRRHHIVKTAKGYDARRGHNRWYRRAKPRLCYYAADSHNEILVSVLIHIPNGDCHNLGAHLSQRDSDVTIRLNRHERDQIRARERCRARPPT